MTIGGSGPEDAWLMSVIAWFRERKQARGAERRRRQERRVRQSRIDRRHEQLDGTDGR